MIEIEKRNQVWRGLVILVGTGLMAVSVNCVFEPMQLVTGGVT